MLDILIGPMPLYGASYAPLMWLPANKDLHEKEIT